MAAATCNRLISLKNSGQWTATIPNPFPNHHIGRGLSDPDRSRTGIPGFPSSADSFEAFDAIARDNQAGLRASHRHPFACSIRSRAPMRRAPGAMGGQGTRLPTKKMGGLPCSGAGSRTSPLLPSNALTVSRHGALGVYGDLCNSV